MNLWVAFGKKVFFLKYETAKAIFVFSNAVSFLQQIN